MDDTSSKDHELSIGEAFHNLDDNQGSDVSEAIHNLDSRSNVGEAFRNPDDRRPNKTIRNKRWARRLAKISTNRWPDLRTDRTKGVREQTKSNSISLPSFKLPTPLPFRRRKTSKESCNRRFPSASLPDLTENAELRSWESQKMTWEMESGSPETWETKKRTWEDEKMSWESPVGLKRTRKVTWTSETRPTETGRRPWETERESRGTEKVTWEACQTTRGSHERMWQAKVVWPAERGAAEGTSQAGGETRLSENTMLQGERGTFQCNTEDDTHLSSVGEARADGGSCEVTERSRQFVGGPFQVKEMLHWLEDHPHQPRETSQQIENVSYVSKTKSHQPEDLPKLEDDVLEDEETLKQGETADINEEEVFQAVEEALFALEDPDSDKDDMLQPGERVHAEEVTLQTQEATLLTEEVTLQVEREALQDEMGTVQVADTILQAEDVVLHDDKKVAALEDGEVTLQTEEVDGVQVGGEGTLQAKKQMPSSKGSTLYPEIVRVQPEEEKDEEEGKLTENIGSQSNSVESEGRIGQSRDAIYQWSEGTSQVKVRTSESGERRTSESGGRTRTSESGKRISVSGEMSRASESGERTRTSEIGERTRTFESGEKTSVSGERTRTSQNGERTRTSECGKKISVSRERSRASERGERARTPESGERRTSQSEERTRTSESGKRISVSGERSRASESGERSRVSGNGERSRAYESGERTRTSESGARASESGGRTRTSESGERTRTSESGERTRTSESGERTRTSESGERTKISESGERTRTSEIGERTRTSESGGRTRTSESGERTRRSESGERTRTSESGDRTRTSESGARTRTSESGERTRTSESGERTKALEDEERRERKTELRTPRNPEQRKYEDEDRNWEAERRTRVGAKRISINSEKRACEDEYRSREAERRTRVTEERKSGTEKDSQPLLASQRTNVEEWRQREDGRNGTGRLQVLPRHDLDKGHALKSLSRSTPAMSPSASPRHSDSEGQPRVSKGTKKFMRHFAEAPPSEWVLNYFSCALVSDILLQGTLYITPNFFAFYSKIFGHVSRLLIPVSQVASLQKERTAKIIPNAVGLQMLDGKSYVFGSLLSRDSTYKLMQHIWKKAKRMADSDSEPPSAVQVAVDDDGDDSVSGSAESLMEDQADSYLASSPPTLPPLTDPPWSSNKQVNNNNNITTTTATAASDNCTAVSQAVLNNTGISVSSVTGTVVTQRGGIKSGTPTPEEPSVVEGEGDSLLQWFTQGSLIKTCFRMGSIPMKVVGEGVCEVWALPRTSLLLLMSTLLLLLLFASAAFMLHRVDLLSQQLGLEKYDEYDTMYEEVLQMQQRLHAAASTEIEKTLSIQLKHIATVRQSLEALMVLFSKEPPPVESAAQIPDNT